MDPNAYTTPFQLTKSLKRDLYPSIDPKNPAISAKGKTIPFPEPQVAWEV